MQSKAQDLKQQLGEAQIPYDTTPNGVEVPITHAFQQSEDFPRFVGELYRILNNIPGSTITRFESPQLKSVVLRVTV